MFNTSYVATYSYYISGCLYTCMHTNIHVYLLGLCDNGKTYISIMPIMHYIVTYLDNDIYRNKIMIGYYAYILDFCSSKIALCPNIFVCFV